MSRLWGVLFGITVGMGLGRGLEDWAGPVWASSVALLIAVAALVVAITAGRQDHS